MGKDSEKVYTVDLNCDDFSILAFAKTDQSDKDEAEAATEAQIKPRTEGDVMSGAAARMARETIAALYDLFRGRNKSCSKSYAKAEQSWNIMQPAGLVLATEAI